MKMPLSGPPRLMCCSLIVSDAPSQQSPCQLSDTNEYCKEMREDLRSQNLTFTEIAKLVGENWQNLNASEKEAYESQANADKEKYHRDLMEYKKTADYRKYMQYLHEFKEKQAKRTQGS